ncbi:MAG: hypothetical protein Q8K67_11155 [Geothrix sp.]|nr:hypothetical protein [Geothrix sp.]
MHGALFLLLAAPAMAGYGSNPSKTPAPMIAAPSQAPVAAPRLAPGSQMPKDASHAGVPAAQVKAQPAPAMGEPLTGEVLERLDAPPYCYLRLKTAKGEVWAAIPEAKAEKGAEVTVANAMLMTDFPSKTLNRTFAEVYFGTLATADTASPAAGNNPHAQAGQTATAAKVGKIGKASGADARTVSQVWAQKDGLKEKSVTVRGKVVKYSTGVLGKNWMHLQDGSGNRTKGTNDITVTTQDEVAMGDTVTIRGVVRVNKDFGAGYSYAVIIEDAKVVKK